MSPRVRGLSWVGLMPWVLLGCGSSAQRTESEKPKPARVASTRGSAVVLSRDERVAVVTNRSAGVVTVFHLNPEQPQDLVQGKTEIDLGEGSEPWAAVIGADDDTAYLISRRDQLIYRVLDLHGVPELDSSTVRVGSEPTAIAISPKGTRLFVANWGEGTISTTTTYGFATVEPLDLNVALVEAGLLGDIAQRSALAHPRALAITDDGDEDDSDETVYATEFFSQPIPNLTSDGKLLTFDRNRQGIVYPIKIAEGKVGRPIPIAPVDDTGFYDVPNTDLPPDQRNATGCVPNQLYAAAAAGGRLFVSAMCASPLGPLGTPRGEPTKTANFKTVVHPALFVIDTTNDVELADQKLVLTRKLEDLYAADQTPDGRMPLIPNDLAFTPAGADGLTGCLTAFGADAVFCVTYGDAGPIEIGASGARFVDLHGDGPLRPRLPIGIALSQREHTPFALVVNDGRQSMSVVEPGSSQVLDVVPAVDETREPAALQTLPQNRGRALFATGLRGWSFKGQAWNSCESCHPDGLSDGLTWFFARGPRRSISTAGTFDSSGGQRLMLWTAAIDEVHDVEAIVRTVAGGAGAILWRYDDFPSNDLRILYDGSSPPDKPGERPKVARTLMNGMNGSLASLLQGKSCDEPCDSTQLFDWDEIEAFIRSVRTPRPPITLDPGQVAGGNALFREGGCAACHGGPGFTISKLFYEPNERNNGRLPYLRPATFEPRSELLGLLRTTSYTVPPELPALAALNPPLANKIASFRRWAPAERPEIDVAYPEPAAPPDAGDQINCALRAVGTFPTQPESPAINSVGIFPAGAPDVQELRQDMKTLAFGKDGFNVPSLVGLAAGAPYFHAGNARTLEEVFDPVFARHYQAINPEFLPADQPNREDRVRALVAYLLSIDDETPAPVVPPGYDLCAGFGSGQ